MYSVTQRIKTVSQPFGGYVPKNLFVETQYDDMYEVEPIVFADKSLYSIQGMAVDYLTRYLLTGNKEQAFDISIRGAQIIDDAYENNKESKHISELLSNINGLDDDSIYNACKVVGYDTVYRSGLKTYRDVENIIIPKEMVSNIRYMVKRGLLFLEAVGPIVSTELTFEGGYTEIVSSGDGDYLADDMIIDFKVSKTLFSSKWSLQLLMYYLLGIHSVHKKYQNVKYLCLFNPFLNKSLIVYLPAISDEVKYRVSNEVLGYKMDVCSWDCKEKNDYSSWRNVDGTDKGILLGILNDITNNTEFDVDDYGDGIHHISIDEYWNYVRKTIDGYSFRCRPIFRHVDHMVMIKKNGYLMFFSISTKGNLCILNGAKTKKAVYPLEYYYDNIEKYANAIIRRFSKYWDALREISKQLQELEPSEESLRALYSERKRECERYDDYIEPYDVWCKEKRYKLTGHIHGCIVDIDWSSHIYLNPYDGTIVPYHAFSMYDKDVYKNTKSLIASQRPDMLEPFNQLKVTNPNSLLIINNKMRKKELVSSNDEIDKNFTKVYSYDMYSISSRLIALQKIYDLKLIVVWYDEILNDNVKLIEDKYKP